MAIEFKNGIVVDGTGTVLDIQGSQGQLFSITDSLTGDLFSVSDISGVPILNVNSSGAVGIDGNLGVNATASDFHADANDLVVGSGSGNTGITIHSGTSGFGSIYFADGTADDATEKRGQIRYLQGTERMDFHTDAVATAALSLSASGNATFSGSVTSGTTVLTGDQDLSGYLTSLGTAIVDADFSGTSGFMKKSSAGTYTLDTNTYSTATGVANNADVTPSWVPANDPSYLTSETSHTDVLVDGEFTAQGFMVRGASSGSYSIDTNTYITSQRAISSTPTTGASTTAISSDWAFDNVKTAVPTNAVFTDTVNTLAIGNGSGDAMAGNTSIPSISGLASTTYVDNAESDAIAAAATAGNAAYVALGGSTMTGALTLSGAPTNNSHAATKAYVDGAVIADTDTQDLTISGRTITLDRGGNVTVPAPTYASVTGKPATFAPIIGSTSATAMAGNTTIPSGNQILDWTASQGGETKIHSNNITFPTMYTHPSYATTNINTSGSTIIDSITTNGTGHITAMGTRTLALSDLGFSGNSAANCVLNATQTLTNKVIDADNNTISDLVVSNLKASAVVLESEGISSNDNDTTIPTSAAVKDYVDSAVIADTDTQDLGISGNSVTLDRGGSADISTITAVANNTAKTSFPGFGTSNTTALRGDTSIPSISGLASTSYVDTAEADAITAAASAAAGLYVPSAGTTTIGGTKTFTGSLILNDGVGSSPTQRFMNADTDEVSIFCNPTGKMNFQQKLAGGSNVVQMTMDENGLNVVNGIKINSTSVLPAVDEDAFGSNSSTLVPTQQSVKAYVDNAVSSAGGGTMSNFTIRDDGGNDHQIDQGEFIQFDGVNCTFNRTTNPTTNNTSTPVVMTVTVPKGITANDFLICGSGIADDDFIRINGTTVEGRSASQVLSDIGAQASGTYSTATGVENNADVTDATNVAAAGALMDSEVTNLSQVKGFTSSDYATAAQGTLADSALQSETFTSVPNNHVTNARLASITKGSIIHGNGSGNPAYLAIGTTAGHVLTVGSSGQIEWAASSGGSSSYSLPTASTSTLGGVKLGNDLAITQSFNTATTGVSSRTYPIQINGSGQLAVSVPWTNSERGAGAMLDVDGSGDLEVDLFEATSATIVAADELIFLDAGATEGAHRGSVGDLAAALTDNTGGLTTSSGIIKVNPGSGIELNANKVTVKLNPTNTGLQLDQTNGLSVKVASSGGIAVDASDQLTLNSDITSVDTIYNTALHVGRASNQMHCDYSAATSSSGGEIRWYSNTTEVMALGYEGNLEVLDDVTADSQILTSDRKLKKNIEPLNYGLNEVLKLKPVRYEWKESYKKGKGTMVGFVSQDVQEVIPEVINESKIIGTEETKLGIDYSKIVAVLTNAIQEQQKQIDELKKIVYGNTN